MSDNVQIITDASFQKEVLECDVPVLIDFWAVWCMPCKAIAPIVEEIANEYTGKIKVGKMDIDHNKETAMKYGIRSIPTLLIFKDGQVVDTIVGSQPKNAIVTKIDGLF